ncbi:MAG: hypothetical protein LBD23_10565 [Oscillospiraceae bacterium]|jgi:hypothetical protein|nr:hypothetical protein [Oscillospiraceae bacterium]
MKIINLKIKGKRFVKAVVICLCVGFLIHIIIGIIYPPLRSDRGVKKYVLNIIPVGSSVEDVIEISNTKNWEIHIPLVNVGYFVRDGHPPMLAAFPGGVPWKGITVIGNKTMVVIIGSYFFGSVGVFLGFDENSELVDVAVIRYVSAL